MSDEEVGSDAAPIDRGAVFKALSDALDADLFVYSGPIERPQAGMFLDVVEASKTKKNVCLVICTLGGDADAAYIIARFVKSMYEKFTLYVFGHCKSAGTLIALGANEIVMSHRGELGPLDVQVFKADELVFRGSGLDIGKAIESLSEDAFEAFERCFLNMIRKGGGAITTKTAADIATTLAVGLVSPITAQIDPLRVGEMERAINIATEYGMRLNVNQDRVQSLIHDYPSHTFVIDYDEASSLFKNVRRPTDLETTLEQILQDVKDEEGRKYIRTPDTKGWMAYLKPKSETENETQQEPSNTGEAENRGEVAAAGAAAGVGGQHDGDRVRAQPAQTTREAAPARQPEGSDGNN